MDAIALAGIIVIAIFSITSHEAAHGFAADLLGDPTAREQGRLTLNPLPHIDPLFTILLPLLLIVTGAPFIFGGAKPVPINPRRLRQPRRDTALVGAAGPLMNIAIAALLTIVFALTRSFGSQALLQALAVGVFINALLAVFNLIPLPPLDGSRVVQYFLPPGALAIYHRVERFGLLIIIAVLWFAPQLLRPLLAAIGWLIAAIATPFGVQGEITGVLAQTFAR